MAQCALLISAGIILFFGRRFLTTLFSDVRYWSALNENDSYHETRNAILERTAAMIRHLVSDTACVRVIIVSHSLGTAIAYDALNLIGLQNLARDQIPCEQIAIRKVDCFITMGSPIDKLALLFETTGSQTFREELMRDELRGDLTKGPFWVKGRQRIRWLNFWDRADPICDALYSPLGAKPRGDHFEDTSVENIEVANTKFFSAAASHTGYLRNPVVASQIFSAIFQSDNFHNLHGPSHESPRFWSRLFVNSAVIGLLAMLLFFAIASTQ
jgi:hypothetical protein